LEKLFFPFLVGITKQNSMLIIKTICIWKQFEKALLWFLKLFIPYNWSLLQGKEEEWMNEWSSYQSIHSIFPFIKDIFPYFNCILDLTIPDFIHPKLLIWIFCWQIQDAYLFHLFQFIFHRNCSSIMLDTHSIHSQKKKNMFVFIFVESLYLWIGIPPMLFIMERSW